MGSGLNRADCELVQYDPGSFDLDYGRWVRFTVAGESFSVGWFFWLNTQEKPNSILVLREITQDQKIPTV